VPSSPALYTERMWSHHRTNFRHRLYYFLCHKLRGHWSNFTKFLQDVQKSLPITHLKSKLRSSNQFWNARVLNEDRSSNCGRVAAKIARFNGINSENIGQKFIKLYTMLQDYCYLIFWKRLHDRRKCWWTPEQRVKIVVGDVCEQPPNVLGCYNNIILTIAKRISW